MCRNLHFRFLQFHRHGNVLVFNNFYILQRVDNNCVSNVQFPIETTVGSVHGSLDALIPSHREVIEKIRKELVEPVYTGTGREISTQTTERSDEPERRRDPDDDPLRVGPMRRAPRQPW